MLDYSSVLTYKRQSPEMFLASAGLLTNYVGEYDMADEEVKPNHYIPQVPCKRGHMLRYKKSGLCVCCLSIKKTGRPLGVWRKCFRSDYTNPPHQFEGPFDNCICIPLTKGCHALIDIEDFEAVATRNWTAKENASDIYYAARRSSGKEQRLHIFLMGKKQGMVIDHINGNGLDNRRANLRFCTPQENGWNSIAKKGSAKGVDFVKARHERPWRAQTRFEGKCHHLGYFDTQQEAIDAYNKFAEELHGDFFYLKCRKN